MGKPKPPESPDYAAAATAQGAANVDAARTTARLSNPFMVTPYGTQTVEWDGDTPHITQRLTETGQHALNQQQQAELGLATTANEQTQAIRSLLNTPFNFEGQVQRSLPNAGAIAQLDTSDVAKAPINAGTTAQQAILSRLAPQQARNRQSVETQLINQGLRPGGEAYDNAIRLLGEQENDQLTQAALQGITLDMGANQQGFNQALNRQQAANAAQSLGFGQNLSGAQFGNTALQQALAQALTQRDVPINEITALLSGSQVQNPQFPGYQGANVAPAPLFAGTQAQGAFDMDQYAQQVAQRNGLLGGLFGLGTAGIGGLFGLGR